MDIVERLRSHEELGTKLEDAAAYEIERLRAYLEKRIKDYVDLAIEVERLKLRLHVKGQQTTEADNWEDEGGSTHE